MSFVNHKYKHIFIHVPKCAGTSMERVSFVGGHSHAPARYLIPQAPNYFSWGFVRDPYDRLVSGYAYTEVRALSWLRERNIETFHDFVMQLDNYYKKPPQFIPLTGMLCDNDGNILVDFVGRYEQLVPDWQYVCERLGQKLCELKRVKSSKHPPWRRCYTPEMVAIVNRLYRTDFEIFDYPMM